MIQAVLRNAAHPEYGEATIPFPIPEEEYGHCLELREALEIGNAVNRDCKVQEIQEGPPILKRLEGSRVNLDELDYLAKRLDSFTDQELAQFQSAAVSYDYSNIVDLINLTFSCQEVTVITDFSDLESIGRNHYMTLNGGSARMEELDNLDGTETALLLIESGDGVITPYGATWAQPPPAAPPLTPNTGPREGSRRATTDFLPSFRRPSASPTEVVVLPSPAGVGVMAVTRISLPS